MNWKSEEGRALLRRACPEGYLTMRGIHSLDGFVCVEHKLPVTPYMATHHWWRSGGPHPIHHPKSGWWGARAHELRVVYLASGGMLPLPDTADHATWACLLAHLEQRLLEHPDFNGWPVAANETITGRSLRTTPEEAGQENPIPFWQFCIHTDFGHTYSHDWSSDFAIREGCNLPPGFCLDTDDAEEALVWMLVMLNEPGVTGP